MAATVTAGPSPTYGPKLESLNYIDMTKFSQAELHTLSLCSDSALDIYRSGDVLVPSVDRTGFNESAGGRRQIYSHLRGGYHQTRLPGLHSRPIDPPSYSDPEFHSILHYLKHYLEHNSVSDCPPPPLPPPLPSVSVEPEQKLGLDSQENFAIALHAADRKRKRVINTEVKANRRLLENGDEIELGRLNKKGEDVDFVFLESKGDELYRVELERRTAGMETEEEVLKVLTSLEGQWGSTRKRRKYVDASDFGDALPVGWKLLLGIKRRIGHVSLFCRRIVSPTGEEFLSCKEVSSFLRSYFEGRTINQPKDMDKSIVVASGSCAGMANKADDFNHGLDSDTTQACSTASGLQENELCTMGIDDLPDIQLKNVFECSKCRLTFEEEKKYVHHLMSFHQRTTRRYKVGGSIGEGVIIKDGKFECQFCHKVFLERRSYNGHVGVHVRTRSKVLEVSPLPESVCEDVLHPTTLKNNASVEDSRNIITTTPNASEAVELSCHSILHSGEALAKDTNQGAVLDANCTQMETEALEFVKAPSKVLNPRESKSLDGDGEFIYSTDRHVEMNLKSTSTDGSELPIARESESSGNNEKDMGLMYSSGKLNENVGVSKGLVVEKNITASPMPPVALSNFFPTTTKKKHEIVTEFEDLGLDDMETFKYDFVDREEPSSLPRVSVDMQNHEMIAGFNSSVGFGSDEIMIDMDGAHQLVTVCVWCRAEFKVATFDPEPQMDSIGYMCPACKENISGHFGSLCP